MGEIELYTLQEAADILKVSRQSVYNFVKDKRLKAAKVGREYRVTKEDLKEFIESQKTK